MAADPDAAAKAMEAKQEAEALKDMAAAALLVRNALIAALPVAPEQYLTLTVPGTVIDTEDIANGGTFVYDATANPFTPTAVRQAEAKLVDGMMPLANIMIGNTGKSIARSYASALDYLVPKKATVSTDKHIRSPGSSAYKAAMSYLTSVDSSGNNPVAVYIEKQTAWAKAQDAWDAAKIEARNEAARTNPGNNAAAVQEYDDWSQSHYRRFKEATQACWMDWVTNGDKYNVEYNFGVVDVDSIMGRIESSKQSMRNSTIVDADGANEIQEVNLTPKTWAKLCKDKADGYYTRNGNFSIDQLNSEISRLQQFGVSLAALKAELQKTPPGYPKANPGPKPDIEKAKADLNKAYTDLYEEQGKLNSVVGTDGAGNEGATVDALRQALGKAIQAWEDTANSLVKWNLSQPQGAQWLDNLITTVEGQVSLLQKKGGDISSTKTDLIAAIVSAQGSSAAGNADGNAGSANKTSGNNLATPGYEMANPIFGIGPTNPSTTSAPPADPWTKITASFSATDQKTAVDTSSWGFSAGGGVGFGLFSIGGSYSHESSSVDMRMDMAQCDVSLTFSALVVNIDRPWLYGELFDDFEIDIAVDARLSPGPELLHQWIDSQTITSLAMYNVFPAYATSFIVAADTEITFTGKTSHIESHFHSVSNSATASVGWGPFSASGGYHSTSTHSAFQIETTATGCTIKFAAPQIIAWVSQILPALPRDDKFEPLLQTSV